VIHTLSGFAVFPHVLLNISDHLMRLPHAEGSWYEMDKHIIIMTYRLAAM